MTLGALILIVLLTINIVYDVKWVLDKLNVKKTNPYMAEVNDDEREI